MAQCIRLAGLDFMRGFVAFEVGQMPNSVGKGWLRQMNRAALENQGDEGPVANAKEVIVELLSLIVQT